MYTLQECSPNSKETKKLQFRGAGPKNAEVDKEARAKGRTRKTVFYDHDPVRMCKCVFILFIKVVEVGFPFIHIYAVAVQWQP